MEPEPAYQSINRLLQFLKHDATKTLRTPDTPNSVEGLRTRLRYDSEDLIDMNQLI